MIQGPGRTKQLINPQVQSKGRVVGTMSPGRGARQKASPTQRQDLFSVPRLRNFHKKESSFLVQQRGGLFSSLSLYSLSYPLITVFWDLFPSSSPSSQWVNGALFLLPWRNCGSLAAWEALLGTKEEGWFLLWGFEKKNEYIVGTPCGSLGLGRDGGPACETLSPGAVPWLQPDYIMMLCPYSAG